MSCTKQTYLVRGEKLGVGGGGGLLGSLIDRTVPVCGGAGGGGGEGGSQDVCG